MGYCSNTYCGACLKVNSLTSKFLYEEHLDETFYEVATDFFPDGKCNEIVMLIPNVETKEPVNLDLQDSTDFVEITPSVLADCVNNFENEFAKEIAQIRDIVGFLNAKVVFVCMNYLT